MHNELPNKYYFINKFDTNYIDKQDKSTALIYRNYNNKIEKNLILKIQKYCKKRGNRFLLSNNIKLAINLNLDGAYIPSFNKNLEHLSYSYRKNFIIVGSAHNLKEIRDKELQGVNCIFLSSLFKINKNYLGVNRFKLLSLLTKKKIIALGGISKTNLKKLNLINYYGFAGITFFE
jgi:thiamine-phosphate pyrophosphorylase